MERVRTSKGWPKLKAKAAATRHVIHFCIHLMETFGDLADEEGDDHRVLAETLRDLPAVLDYRCDAVPPPQAMFDWALVTEGIAAAEAPGPAAWPDREACEALVSDGGRGEEGGPV